MSEYVKSLYVLNKEQQKYSKKLELTITFDDKNETMHYSYNKINFGLDDIPINLDEFSKVITDKLKYRFIDAGLIYTVAIEILAEKLNPFDIGIVVNKQMEMWLEKKIDKLQMLDSYSDFCKVTDNRKVSIKEYEENIWKNNKFS